MYLFLAVVTVHITGKSLGRELLTAGGGLLPSACKATFPGVPYNLTGSLWLRILAGWVFYVFYPSYRFICFGIGFVKKLSLISIPVLFFSIPKHSFTTYRFFDSLN